MRSELYLGPIALVPLLLSLLLLLQTPTSSDAQLLPQAPVDMVAADSLAALYMRLEHALWLVIGSTSADSAEKLRRIHETHLTLFATDFREKGVQLSRLDVDQRHLLEAIGTVNMTVSVLRDSYLHENARDRQRDNALNYARFGVNMSHHMETLFNVTEFSDFYHYVARKGELQSCDLSDTTIQSTHQLIYDYYHDIAIGQLKAYALTQLAYMFQTVYAVPVAAGAPERLRHAYLQRSARAQERVRSLLAAADREVWVCDPDDPQPMQHAAEVTRLLQGYVDNEVNLNEVNDCKRTCPDYQLTRNYQCYNGSHCADNREAFGEAELRCNGAVVGCDFVSANMEICHSDDPTRRYDAIRYTCGKKMGATGGECTGRKTQATSWTRWLVQCSQCFCYCDEPGLHSDRYFSLRPVLSDVTKNKIITGVAIRKINRIFYWQIIEHPLTGNAEVDTSAAPTHPLTPGDSDGFSLRSTFRIGDPNVADGIDYHTLSHANRSVTLDVLHVPAGTVCTGVRFAVEQGSLKLAVRGTRFNFRTGQLSAVPEDSIWVSNTIYQRTEIRLDAVQVPQRSLSKSVPDLRPGQYVQFGPSDRWSDVAQSTVPFIDTQTVRPQVAVPLAGIGLYYKGVPGFGGYVAPKVVTFDYASYVKNL